MFAGLSFAVTKPERFQPNALILKVYMQPLPTKSCSAAEATDRFVAIVFPGSATDPTFSIASLRFSTGTHIASITAD
jgi:hypothetical protein